VRRFSGPDLFACTACDDQATARLCSWQATSLSKLDGPGADKEAVSQQLATVQQQVEQVRGENEELRTFFQEALQASA